MSWFAIGAGGVRVPLNLECQIELPDLKPVGSVEMTPSGRLFRSTTTLIPQATQIRVDWVARGTDPDSATQELADLTALLDSAERLYHGEWWLTVLRLEEAPKPQKGFGGLKWTGSHTYTVINPLFTHPDGRTSRMPATPTGDT